ncbi:hypothetical protein ACJDU8_24650 [Clostridium sp. WILCCON 0269]|uniref:Bacterial Ig-like domain-containing protein n=1 Tax=Candidatus Clostridium eludens TaxID=3381663 RepID=A0ABW8SSF5_9CLOT
MANKKIYMGLSKIAIAAIIATSLSGVVYAKDGDIYKLPVAPSTSVTNEGGIGNIILNKSSLIDLIVNMSKYGYEAGSKIYKASDANAQWNANPTATSATIYSNIEKSDTALNYTPVATSNTLVGTFSSVFGQSYVTATLPTGATIKSVTSDGTALASTSYSLSRKTLTILGVTSANTVTITTGDGTVYALVNTSSTGGTTTTIHRVEFASAGLTKTGTNTVAFQYKVIDENGTDITKIVPASEISAVASVSSSIVLEPSTGIGTITFSNSSDVDKQVIVTLFEMESGTSVYLDTSNPGTGIKGDSKVSKIMITSTTLDLYSSSTSGVDNGYATYKVLDQYGNDITTSALAQDITWTCNIGTITASNGVLTVSPFISGSTLTKYATTTIAATDQSTGTTTSANLTVPQSQTTLSNITLNNLYCTNNANAVLTDGDTTDSFYIDYTATDSTGNTTKSYDLINAGLVKDDDGNVQIVSSDPTCLQVQLVRDPNNYNNAAIQVSPKAGDLVADQPINITVSTLNGKTSTIDLTLKKKLMVDTLTLIAPSHSVAAGDTDVNIPFKAYDQNGNALTKYSDINDNTVILTSDISSVTGIDKNLDIIQNPDGTASIEIKKIPALIGTLTSQTHTIQAIIPNNGKFSTLNIVVHAAAVSNK